MERENLLLQEQILNIDREFQVDNSNHKHELCEITTRVIDGIISGEVQVVKISSEIGPGIRVSPYSKKGKTTIFLPENYSIEELVGAAIDVAANLDEASGASMDKFYSLKRDILQKT